MNLMPFGDTSPFMKMKQVYWEARQAFKKSLGEREDSYIVSSDSELDIKLELLQAADDYFNSILKVLFQYQNALQNVIQTQDNLGVALIEYGTKDVTPAGKLMCMCGKTLSKAAQRQSLLNVCLMTLFHEIQTFQFNATADALQTVAKMEKVRNSYRSGLLWMKNASVDLDPDVNKKLKKFRKIQEHMKHLKVRFDGVKLECMQKIDLFLLSRSNLFSHTVPPYCKTFKKMHKYSLTFSEFALKNIPLYLSYNFVTLKQLNEYSKNLQSQFQQMNPIEQQTSENQAKYRRNVQHSKSKSVKIDPFKNSDSRANDYLKNKRCEPVQIKINNPSDTLLIDLSETNYKGETTSNAYLTSNKSISLPASKYSEDLLSINFESSTLLSNSVLTEKNETSGKEYKRVVNLLEPVPKQADKIDSDELQFWSLIQKFGIPELSPKPTEAPKLEETSSTLVPKKVTPNVLSDSKLTEILVQFDPFEDESLESKDNSEYI